MSSETFSEFKDSFSYGSRNDLNFKFLKHLSDDEAARFFQDLLTKLGDTINDGDVHRLIDHVTAGQSAGYANASSWTYDEGPFTQLEKPLNQCRIGLLTSTGHFVDGQDPRPFGVENMSQEEAAARINEFLREAPTLSEISLDTSPDKLRVRHGGYDIRGVQADRNVALPLDRMRELEAEGVVGTAVSPAYSFVGAAAQTRVIKQTAPQWAKFFQAKNIEGMVLVPV